MYPLLRAPCLTCNNPLQVLLLLLLLVVNALPHLLHDVRIRVVVVAPHQEAHPVRDELGAGRPKVSEEDEKKNFLAILIRQKKRALS